jgi:hypothetical protein
MAHLTRENAMKSLYLTELFEETLLANPISFIQHAKGLLARNKDLHDKLPLDLLDLKIKAKNDTARVMLEEGDIIGCMDKIAEQALLSAEIPIDMHIKIARFMRGLDDRIVLDILAPADKRSIDGIREPYATKIANSIRLYHNALVKEGLKNA